MIYVASVYSYQADKRIMQERFEVVESFVAAYNEFPLLSPIVYTHELAKRYDLPKEYSYWQERDRHFIALSSEVWVLKMEHWEKSVGVTDEIKYAESLGIPVKYFEVEDV